MIARRVVLTASAGREVYFVASNDEEVNGAGFVPPLSHQKLQIRQDLQALRGGQGQFATDFKDPGGGITRP